MPDGTEELIRALYEAPPEGFVAGRAAAVADARRSGDKETAKRLAALRKPTVAAWLVNLLALRRPELIDELVELSTALRAAQRGLHGEQLRELSTQRRRLVSELVNAAQRLAVEDDPGLRAVKLPMAEVEATLTAALAEPEIAEQVRGGRLVRAATYAGFGEVPRPRLRLVTAEDPPERAAEEPGSAVPSSSSVASSSVQDERRRKAADKARQERAERRRELERELTAARAADVRARSRLERAESAERDAGHAVDELEEQLAELERQRIVAQAELSRRKLARRSSERDASAARRQVGDVEAAIEDLDADEPDH